MGLDRLSAPAEGRERGWFRWPKSRFLLNVCSWLALCCLWKLGFMLDQRPHTTTEVVGQLILGTFSAYFGGAITSAFPFVSGLAVVAAVTFLLTVLVPSLHSRRIAKASFSIVIVLSLFTLWIENYLTVGGIAVELAMLYAKVSLLVPDIVVTVAWLYGWIQISQLVDQEYSTQTIVLAGATNSSTVAGSPGRLSWVSLPPRTGQWLLVAVGSFAIVLVLAVVVQSAVPTVIMLLGVHPLLTAGIMSRIEPEEMRNHWRTAGWFAATLGATLVAGLALGAALAILNH